MAMLCEQGEHLLKEFDEKNHSRARISQIAEDVWFVSALGHSNAVFIEGEDSVILIDALDTAERGEKLRSIIREHTRKPVSTIIYTHGHPDHRGGAGAFRDEAREIIASKPAAPILSGTEILKDIQGIRGKRQFGYGLSDEEALSQGLGPREGINYGEHHDFLPPTTLYDEELVIREISGVRLELRRLPGETDDQIAVWIPERLTLCCGDNYYGCFPNLYAIRGGQYRDIASWIRSLGVLMEYPAEHLLPGHTGAVNGRKAITEVLGNYKGMMEYILSETLRGMNEGKTADELSHEIRLPEKYAELDYLGEHYGCVEWTVREIYAAYLGWFSGRPSELHPLSESERSRKLIPMMGGAQKVLASAKEAFGKGEYQFCLELCDMLGAQEGGKDLVLDKEARLLSADAMEALSKLETSANGRHYYIACAKEIREKLR